MAWTEVQTDPDWRYYVESCSHVMPCPAARLHPFLLSSAVSQAQASCLVQHVRTFSLKFKAFVAYVEVLHFPAEAFYTRKVFQLLSLLLEVVQVEAVTSLSLHLNIEVSPSC